MQFKTLAVISGDEYGIQRYDKKSGAYYYEPLGPTVYVDEIIEDIEDQSVSWKISTVAYGRKREAIISADEIADKRLLTKALAKIGCLIPTKYFDVFFDTLRLQLEDPTMYNIQYANVYKRNGWIVLPKYDENGKVCGSVLCFRGHKLLGEYSANYQGDYMLMPTGSFKLWQEMVKTSVVKHTPLELALVAGLSAIVVGVLSLCKPIQNPVIHYSGKTGTGKSSAMELICSAFGGVFYSPKLIDSKLYKSLLQSWGSTEAALLKDIEGVVGYPLLLNESGKMAVKDCTRILYNLSEGTSLKRANQRMEIVQELSYATSIISNGEEDLLEKVSNKAGGIEIRVANITDKLTTSAAHADYIKDICNKNYGFASVAIVLHIMKNGGADYVCSLYDEMYESLMKGKENIPQYARFVSKFEAVYLSTALIATEALKIPFDIEGLRNYLEAYFDQHGGTSSTEDASYERLMELFARNPKNFYTPDGEFIPQEAWGMYVKHKQFLSDGRLVEGEYRIQPNTLRELLNRLGYTNLNTCADGWKDKGYIDYVPGDTRNTRRRTVIPRESAKNAYCFYVFADLSPENNKCTSEIDNFKVTKQKRKSHIVNLLEATEDDE